MNANGSATVHKGSIPLTHSSANPSYSGLCTTHPIIRKAQLADPVSWTSREEWVASFI